MDYKQEAGEIVSRLRATVPNFLDGKSAILEMQSGGGKWRHNEWIGFWFEFFANRHLRGLAGFGSGPTFGNVTFDLARNYIWDLKAHVTGRSKWVLLNDQSAVREAVRHYGGIGYVILEGSSDFDDPQMSFKKWHDDLKVTVSAYRAKGLVTGRRSRRRKRNFAPESIRVIWISSEDEINEALARGWMGHFQAGMINADGTPRNSKFKINIALVPPANVVIFETL
jgi:hypothetical protein